MITTGVHAYGVSYGVDDVESGRIIVFAWEAS